MVVGRMKAIINEINKYNWDDMGGLGGKIDCIISKLIFGNFVEEYVAMEFYKKSYRERNKYLTARRHYKCKKRFLNKATQEHKHCIDNKLQFNQFFHEFVHREYCNTSITSEDDVRAFIKKHGTVLAKPLFNSRGRGIMKISYSGLDPELVSKLISGKYLLEEIIVQHPELAKINPSSVNTIRIAVAVDENGRAHPVGACLRCGANGSFVDNTHAGGVSYPLDIENGMVIGYGRNRKTADNFFFHPGSNVLMLGFMVPNWQLLRNEVARAAEKIPEIPYIGWDVAVTENGIDIIEANYDHAAAGIQMDQIGKYKLVKDLLSRKN